MHGLRRRGGSRPALVDGHGRGLQCFALVLGIDAAVRVDGHLVSDRELCRGQALFARRRFPQIQLAAFLLREECGFRSGETLLGLPELLHLVVFGEQRGFAGIVCGEAGGGKGGEILRLRISQ